MFYLGGGGDGEHEGGHSGTAEVQQTTLERNTKQYKVRVHEGEAHKFFTFQLREQSVRMFSLGDMMYVLEKRNLFQGLANIFKPLAFMEAYL